MSKSINVTLIALHVLIIELKPIGNFNVHFILLNLFYKQKASQDMKKKKKKTTKMRSGECNTEKDPAYFL